MRQGAYVTRIASGIYARAVVHHNQACGTICLSLSQHLFGMLAQLKIWQDLAGYSELPERREVGAFLTTVNRAAIAVRDPTVRSRTYKASW